MALCKLSAVLWYILELLKKSKSPKPRHLIIARIRNTSDRSQLKIKHCRVGCIQSSENTVLELAQKESKKNQTLLYERRLEKELWQKVLVRKLLS